MKSLPELDRVDRLLLDIDLRLVELWQAAKSVEEWDTELAMAWARAAYGRGYMDALTFADPEEFFRDHGYQAPKRRAAR